MSSAIAIEFGSPSRLAAAADREHRDRILRFLVVCVGAWGTFGLYYLATGRLESGFLCGVQCLLAIGLYRVAHREWWSFRSIAHASLGVVTAGIVVDALTSGQQQSSSTWFLCCLGLVAAHLLSIRAAIYWTGIAALATIGLSCEGTPLGQLPVWRAETWMDTLLLQLGISVILTAITLQSRIASCEYRSKLEYLASELRERNRFLSLSEEVSGTGHWRLDTRTMMVTYSPHICYLFGEETGHQVTDSLAAFLQQFVKSDADELRAAIQLACSARDCFHLDVSIPFGNDHRYVRVSGISDTDVDGTISSVIGTMRDDTRTRRVQEQLREKNHALSNLANFDFLTGLPNRHHFHDRLRKSLQPGPESMICHAHCCFWIWTDSRPSTTRWDTPAEMRCCNASRRGWKTACVKEISSRGSGVMNLRSCSQGSARPPMSPPLPTGSWRLFPNHFICKGWNSC